MECEGIASFSSRFFQGFRNHFSRFGGGLLLIRTQKEALDMLGTLGTLYPVAPSSKATDARYSLSVILSSIVVHNRPTNRITVRTEAQQKRTRRVGIKTATIALEIDLRESDAGF
jgi:hypothetical protein